MAEEVEEKEETHLPKFEPHQDTSKSYNFEDDMKKLLFKFNFGNALFTKEEQGWFHDI